MFSQTENFLKQFLKRWRSNAEITEQASALQTLNLVNSFLSKKSIQEAGTNNATSSNTDGNNLKYNLKRDLFKHKYLTCYSY